MLQKTCNGDNKAAGAIVALPLVASFLLPILHCGILASDDGGAK